MRKLRIILLRQWQIVPVLFGISIITFLLSQAIPGDPIRLIVGPRATQEVVEAVRRQYGLDQPAIIQYFTYLRNISQGDWGTSIIFKTPVLDLVSSRFLPTFLLLIGGLVFSIIPTLALSILAARNKGSWLDQLVRFTYTVGLGLPSFWLGIVLIMIFSLQLDWLPATGFGNTFSQHITHLILPWTTIGIAMAPILVRNLRATLIEKGDSDFVVAVRSKGLPESHTFRRHIFPNSLLPSLQLLGVVVVYILGISIIIEPIFAIPGLGQLFIRSIIGRDYFVIQGMTLVFAILTILTTLIVDVLSLAIDPRIG